jgi:phenylpropionate dioxygenase-like ring-hydroxylating dioxygenase large terminal subunit
MAIPSTPLPGPLGIGQLILDDRTHRRIYTDAAIFDLEMRQIFENTWVYVGHESEVGLPGDYKTTLIGRQPVILVRDTGGQLRVLVNRCSHRGALVCREEKGNSNFFRCPYHAWTYKSTGELAGAPGRNRYPPDTDFGSLALQSLPNVSSYRGLVFASFRPDVPDLIEYLGPAKRYLDLALDFSPDGEIDLSPGPSRHEYPGNWKLQMENGVDGYHTAFVHETFFEMLTRADLPELKFGAHGESQGWTESFPNGHALLARKPDPQALKSLRETYPAYTDRMVAKHGESGLEEILTHINLFIFPNLFLISHHIRVIQPVSVSSTRVTMYPYLLNGAPRELNERRIKEHESFYPPTGFGSPDDFEIFAAVQEGLQASSVPWLIFARGMHDEKVSETGCFVGRPGDEGHQRGMYREYRRLMTQEVPRD